MGNSQYDGETGVEIKHEGAVQSGDTMRHRHIFWLKKCLFTVYRELTYNMGGNRWPENIKTHTTL